MELLVPLAEEGNLGKTPLDASAETGRNFSCSPRLSSGGRMTTGLRTGITSRFEPMTLLVRSALLAGAIAGTLTPDSTSAHSGDVFHAALKTPVVVDGVLSPGEWADASTKTFTRCFGTSAVRICVKNDATHLYVAVEVENVPWQFNGGTGNDFLNLAFDNNHNGRTDVGENRWAVRGGDGLTHDGHNPNGIPGWNSDDEFAKGTTDLVAAVTHTNPVFGGVGAYTVEYKGLLDSADDAHDFSLAPGQTVGFRLELAIVSCGGFPDSYWPRAYADIVIASDTEPPVLTLELTPSLLWPPNHKLANVQATARAQDAWDPNPQVILASITSNEPDAGTEAEDVPDDIQAGIGDADFDVSLRSERAGEGQGRTYTVCYEARDASGNTTRTCAVVEVPHDRRGAASRWEADGVGHMTEFSSGSVTAEGLEVPGTLEVRAWPNPGSGRTTLAYALPRAGHVRVQIYDISGHLVARLVDRWQPAGRHAATFLSGGRSGVYLYRLDWEGLTSSGKVAIMR